MGDISYRPLIDDMTWSYSRLKTFEDCPHCFFLKYIKGYQDESKFYASYGKFIHKLIERYYNGIYTKRELLSEFLVKFPNEVTGYRPGASTVSKYIDAACIYFKNFQPFPYRFLAVEKEVEFKIDDYNFVGIVDYLGVDDDESMIIVDNKSRDLSPRSGKLKPTLKDKELDEMLRQLYIYAIAIEQEYGEKPQTLGFNCFKAGTFIKEKFDIQKYEEAKQWALNTIKRIEDTDEFEPNESYFYCNYICGVCNHCEYYLEARKERRR